MAIFTAIATAIATSLGMTLAATATATFITIAAGVMQGLVIFGGLALATSLSTSRSGSADYGSTSPTYSNRTIQTQTSQDLPIPLLYGKVKLAGNRIWQDDDGSKTVKRIIGLPRAKLQNLPT